MFCEKHANTENSTYDDEDDDEDVPLGLYEPSRDSGRATKRVTRFIDLGAGGWFGAGSGSGGEASS